MRQLLEMNNSMVSAKVSEAWRREIFNSEPRIDVLRTGKSTTRHPVYVTWRNSVEYVSGGHERIAALLIDQIWALGGVRRWKPQPFNLRELNGPDLTPDFLVELHSRELVVIEVKAKRFITPEVQEKFELEGQILREYGMRLMVWTNADVLTSATSHTVSEIERVRRVPAWPGGIDEIEQLAKRCKTIGELLADFSWDDVLRAIAEQRFFIDITREIDEETTIRGNLAIRYYDHLFAARNDAAEWWDTLETFEA